MHAQAAVIMQNLETGFAHAADIEMQHKLVNHPLQSWQIPAAATDALKFFAWAYAKGDKMALDLDYVPMPDKVVNAIQKVWATQIKDANGKSLFAVTN